MLWKQKKNVKLGLTYYNKCSVMENLINKIHNKINLIECRLVIFFLY